MAILFSAQYIIIALLINFFVFKFTSSYKSFITKGEGKNPKQGLPKVVVRNIILFIIFVLSFLLTYILYKYDHVNLISNSVFLTSSWCAILSTLTYNIGVKEIMEIIKKSLKKYFGYSDNNDNNKTVENNYEEYYD